MAATTSSSDAVPAEEEIPFHFRSKTPPLAVDRSELAARLRNLRYCPIYRHPVPNGILIEICRYLRHDPLSRFSLAKVSSLFKTLVERHDPTYRLVSRALRVTFPLHLNYPEGRFWTSTSMDPAIRAAMMKTCVLENLLCPVCLGCCNMNLDYELIDSEERRYYCGGCNKIHPWRAFLDQELWNPTGQAHIWTETPGILTLCEHKRVLWADIEILKAQPTWTGNFRTSCNDLSHWTCPVLSHGNFLLSRPTVYLSHDWERLNFSWKHHDIVDIDSEVRLDSRAVVDMFIRHCQSGASPLNGSNFYSAMWCMDQPDCTCLDKRYWRRPSLAEPTAGNRLGLGYKGCLGKREHSAHIDSETGVQVSLCQGRSVTPEKQCLVTHYSSSIWLKDLKGAPRRGPEDSFLEFTHNASDTLSGVLDCCKIWPKPGG